MRNLWEAPRSVQHTEKPAPNLKRALKTWTHPARINIPKWATLRLNTGVPIRDKQKPHLSLQWAEIAVGSATLRPRTQPCMRKGNT